MSIIDKKVGMRELKTALYRLGELVEDVKDPKGEEWVRKQFEISFDIIVSILRSELARQGVPTRSARECVIEALQHKLLPKSEIYRRILGDYELMQTKLKPPQAKLIYENIRDHYLEDLDVIYEGLDS